MKLGFNISLKGQFDMVFVTNLRVDYFMNQLRKFASQTKLRLKRLREHGTRCC